MPPSFIVCKNIKIIDKNKKGWKNFPTQILKTIYFVPLQVFLALFPTFFDSQLWQVLGYQ